MKTFTIYIAAVWLLLSSFTNIQQAGTTPPSAKDSVPNRHGYADVNGIKMYYEIYGEGKPLVLLHGGGSTIQTTFGRVIPLLAQHRQLIAVELQAHGRTSDRAKDLTFEQDADDVATLLQQLHINKADFFGFSNGGTTTLQVAIRHPEVVDKMVLGSALCKRNGMPPGFWDFMKQAQLSNMPPELKTAYLQLTSNAAGLQNMHDKDVKRVLNFRDIPDEQLKAIHAPALIIVADQDAIQPEHAIAMHRLLPHSTLAIIPGVHGEYIEEITTLTSGSHEADYVIPMVERFLDKDTVKQ
ncbi:pimeloyl-ACP methyl ester carboxylesterase [Chitinophaga polysaccharea]|uniref:Pimeloyl-ACP methyl ester carboxylesterase n=1 Tax=Chitinophaga polysaccharea TaxID=1293035 RepID=A0A561PP71_9BACT|nr:alpha/beta hydrolase [Chitinophaga polysaccharea]TWF39907.1 pimeloyl-ACP methyl ester carboxylesterase [Chitinophaga polysaccharea]